MRKIIYIFMLIFYSISFYAEELENITIGVERLKYEPYYSYEGDKFTGFSREVFDLFGEKYKYDIFYHVLPVKRLFYEFFQRKDFSFKFPDHPKWEKKMREGRQIFYSKPVLVTVDGFLVRKDFDEKDLKKLKKIGSIGGFTIPSLKKFSENIEIEYSNNYKSLLEKLIHGRIDAAFGNIVVCQKDLRKMGKSPDLLKFEMSLPYKINDYMLSSLSRPDVITQFNEFLEKYGDEISKLRLKYQIQSPLSKKKASVKKSEKNGLIPLLP